MQIHVAETINKSVSIVKAGTCRSTELQGKKNLMRLESSAIIVSYEEEPI